MEGTEGADGADGADGAPLCLPVVCRFGMIGMVAVPGMAVDAAMHTPETGGLGRRHASVLVEKV